MTTDISAPTAELGHVLENDMSWDHWDVNENVAALQWPASIHTYTRMSSEDGRVTSLLEAVKLPLLRTKWRIAQNGARDEVTEFIAREMNLPIDSADEALPLGRTRDRFSWMEHLEESLTRLEFGHAFFEQVYRISDDGRRAHLRKLAARPQDSITAIIVARDGGLVGIRQTVPVNGMTEADLLRGGVTIPVSRLVAYTRRRRPGQWVGRSLLRPAYKHWLLKDDLMRIEAAAARRNGIGVPWVRSAKDDKKQVADAAELASSFRAAEKAGLGLPPGWEAGLLGVQGNLPNLGAGIERHDRAIALAGLAHFLNLDGKGGSYALAHTLSDTFTQAEQALADEQCAVGNAHIVEDLVDINFGLDEPAPLLVCDEIGTRQDLTAAGLKMLVEADLLSPDVLVEQRLRQQLGLPPLPDGGRDDGPDDDDGREPTPAPPAPSQSTTSTRRASARRGNNTNQGALW